MSLPRTLIILLYIIIWAVAWILIEFAVEFREFFLGQLGGLFPDSLPEIDASRLRQVMAGIFGLGLLFLFLLPR